MEDTILILVAAPVEMPVPDNVALMMGREDALTILGRVYLV
jgi:hypothetical protein